MEDEKTALDAKKLGFLQSISSCLKVPNIGTSSTVFQG